MADDEQYLDVYLYAANAIKTLPVEERYKVVGALCVLIGLPLPPPPKPRKDERLSTGSEGK